MVSLEKIAVLIDSDNTQLSKLESVLREISTHGRIIVKKAYGNWKKDTLKKWENEIKRLAIKAEQQFDYTAGKNATDMALVIDAIEMKHSAVYDGFVIVASDSDYTPLAIKLHETGLYVMGVGEKKTPESFRNACDEFIYLENLSSENNEAPKPRKAANSAGKSDDENIEVIHRLLKFASDTYQDDDGFLYVSSAGSFIKRTKPDFDVRTYGYKKLTDFLRAYPKRYEIKNNESKGTEVNIMSYRCL